MKRMTGKILQYDGYKGTILGKDNKEYLLLEHNIKNNEGLKEQDTVSFIPELYATVEVKELIATFVKKVK